MSLTGQAGCVLPAVIGAVLDPSDPIRRRLARLPHLLVLRHRRPRLDRPVRGDRPARGSHGDRRLGRQPAPGPPGDDRRSSRHPRRPHSPRADPGDDVAIAATMTARYPLRRLVLPTAFVAVACLVSVAACTTTRRGSGTANSMSGMDMSTSAASTSAVPEPAAPALPSPSATGPVNLLPGMPAPLSATDVYAADKPGMLSPAVAADRALVYVPNDNSNTVTDHRPGDDGRRSGPIRSGTNRSTSCRPTT